jgi:hypothetical protein
MNGVCPDPELAEIRSLFSIERELVPEPVETRNRAIQRAQAALPRFLPVQVASRSPRPRLVRVGQAAAAAVLLTGLCALAFQAGYHMKSHGSAAPASVPAVTPSVIVVSVPAPPSASSPSTDPERPLVEPSPAKAVARHDFASALAAIAEHQRRFPSGRLAEEREALRVKALLGLGRTAEADRAGAAFGEHFPKSALRGRIDAMLRKQK